MGDLEVRESKQQASKKSTLDFQNPVCNHGGAASKAVGDGDGWLHTVSRHRWPSRPSPRSSLVLSSLAGDRTRTLVPVRFRWGSGGLGLGIHHPCLSTAQADTEYPNSCFFLAVPQRGDRSVWMAQCEAMTTKKRRCPNGEATVDPMNGKWLCHVHHPWRTFRLQQAARKEDRLLRKRRLR